MKFDLILANPPFQDSTNRGKTPHKLWIEFTKQSLNSFLKPGAFLYQVSPSSFQSPSNKVLQIFKDYEVIDLDLRTGKYFPEVGSSFSHYLIKNSKNSSNTTIIHTDLKSFSLIISKDIFYLPNDISDISLSIHDKVIFKAKNKLNVEWDYVTCHNILLRKSDSLSRDKTRKHKFPVFHTNNQIWWSSKRQDWADSQKVMWTRSGYVKPFYDDGEYGGTDMAYFVKVSSKQAGLALAHNLNSKIMQYIFKSAKWSGFGNERVFASLPDLPRKKMSDSDLYSLFKLTREEVDYVERAVEKTRKSNR